MNEITHWNTQRSRTLYGIENWGAGYFDINNDGNISVTPDGPVIANSLPLALTLLHKIDFE